MSNPSQKAICSSRNKSQIAPNDCFFMTNWGWDQKHEVKVFFWSCKSSFWRKYERKRINVRAFSTLRIGLWCHMRSTFEERIFQQHRFSEDVTLFYLFGVWFWTFPKRFLHVCNQFGLEPWRKMMRGGQLSFLSNQIH